MSGRSVTIRFDATYGPTVKVGQKVRRGQCLCRISEGDEPPVCPVTGVVQSIHFEPGDHAFAIAIRPAPKP